MRHLSQTIILFLFWTFFFTSCSENEDNNLSDSTSKIVDDAWYEVKEEKTYNLEEFNDEIYKSIIASIDGVENDIGKDETDIQDIKAFIGKRESNSPLFFKSVVLYYNSVDPQGNKVILSGRFVIQTSSKEADAKMIAPNDICLDNHYTITADWEAPSHHLPFMATMATYNLIVISPDYLGYGVSRNLQHPYLSGEHTAITCVDMVKAVLHYLKDNGVNMKPNYGVINIGYSQSGTVALGVQKYIEQHKELNYLLPLKATYCGGGSYDLECTFDNVVKVDSITSPVYLPLTVIGMKEGYPDDMKGIEVEEYFSEKFNDAHIIDLLKEKKLATTDINKKIVSAVGRPNIYSILSKDALNHESKIYKCFERAMRKNDYTKGWTPQHPLYFRHTKLDDVVPIENMYKVVKGLSNENVFWKTSQAHGHNADCIYFYANGILGGFLKQDNMSYYKASEIDNFLQQ